MKFKVFENQHVSSFSRLKQALHFQQPLVCRAEATSGAEAKSSVQGAKDSGLVCLDSLKQFLSGKLIGRDTPHRGLLHRLIESEEDICITEIILTEILQGIRDDALCDMTKAHLLEFLAIKPKGLDTYVSAANIYRRCRKKGKTVRKTVDCIIAAIVLENRLTLLHNDADFGVIKTCVA